MEKVRLCDAHPAQWLITILQPDKMTKKLVKIVFKIIYKWMNRKYIFVQKRLSSWHNIYIFVLRLSLNCSFRMLDNRQSAATSFFILWFSQNNKHKNYSNTQIISEWRFHFYLNGERSWHLTSKKSKETGSSFSRKLYSATHWPISFTTFCLVLRT